jgi:small subunit ribosomal protein S19
MARSLKKGPYIHYSLLAKIAKAKESTKKTVIKTWSRASMIIPDMVGETIAVHNGKTFVPDTSWENSLQHVTSEVTGVKRNNR